MPMRQFKKTKRILTREEQVTLHENAKAAAQRDREEKQRLNNHLNYFVETMDKVRRELIKVDARTTIVRYIPIEQQNE